MAYTIVYVWEDLDAPVSEQKFGDHFSETNTLEEAFADTRKYVRSSLGRQKHKFNEGRIKLHRMWNATEYALLKGRFGKHQKIDDVIRPVIGYHVSGDVHRIDINVLIERVNRELIKHHQSLPLAGLSISQIKSAENVLAAFAENKKTVVAELCPRFGKTIWSGVIVRETDIKLTIVASYVLTSFASFRNDLTSFDQFRNFVLIDAGESNWKINVQNAINANLQTIVFLSMCAGEQRQNKIDFLFGLNVKRLLIVDEADFGIHQTKQALPLIDAQKENDVTILMTGTNADKAGGVWPVDHYLSVTYPELVIAKRNKHAIYQKNTLKNFMLDCSRHDLVVDVEFYQMDLISVINNARVIDPDIFVQDGIFLPSWSKFAANPVKAKGFFINMLQAVFEGKGGDDSINVDYQTGRKAKEGLKVAMMFLPGSTTNANLQEIKPFAEQALRGFRVVLVSGSEDISNASAEREVKDAIELAEKNNQHVLILSAGMAQRSFSIPQITELYLAYDSGDNGATIQKMSRTLTPNKEGKVGRVISLSFDPNRDDKFDAMILETARNYKKTHGIIDMKQSLTAVMRTLDIFKCHSDGAVKIESDTYLEQALSRKSIDRLIGKIAPVDNLSITEIAALAGGNVDVFRAARKEVAIKGKTRFNVTKQSKSKINTSNKDLKLAREMIVTISQNIDIIRYYGGNNIEESFLIMDTEGPDIQNDVTEQFGVDYDLVKELVLSNFINRDLLDLKFSA